MNVSQVLMSFSSCLDIYKKRSQVNEGPHYRSISETALKSGAHKKNGIPKGISFNSKTSLFLKFYIFFLNFFFKIIFHYRFQKLF